MISGLQSFAVSSETDSPQFRESKRRVERGSDERIVGNTLIRRLRVEGVASAREREDAMGMTRGERRRLDAMRQRDFEVRAHEQAHVSASAGLTMGPPKYTLAEGPDGNKYAIAGHVSIDTTPEPTPEATIEKAQRIKAAATAPADPSPQDLKVASRASMMEMRARGELQAQKMSRSESGETSFSDGVQWNSSSSDRSTSIDSSWTKASEIRHRASDPGHLADCPTCQQKAFEKRFRPDPVQVFGVA